MVRSLRAAPGAPEARDGGRVTVAAVFEEAVRLHRAARLPEAVQGYARALGSDPHHSAAWCNLAVAARSLGRLPIATTACRRALAVEPGHVEALGNLGILLKQQGQPAAAAASLRRVVLLQPADLGMRGHLITVLKASGQSRAAEGVLRGAAIMDPANAAAWSERGTLLLAQGNPIEGLAAARRAALLQPRHTGVLLNLNTVAAAAGEGGLAIDAARRAAEVAPLDTAARFALAETLRRFAPARAERQFHRALALDPGFAEGFASLCDVLLRAGGVAAAEQAGRRAVRAAPANERALNNLGVILLNTDRAEEGETLFRRALTATAAPRAEIVTNLGSALKALGRLDEATDLLQRATAMEPGLKQSYNNLGNVLREYGLAETAVAAYARSTRIDPAYASGWRNLLPSMLYSPSWSLAERFAVQRAWNGRLARPHPVPARPHGNDRTPDRRLRLGYLSSDFRSHVVARNVLPIFENHDRSRFAVTCYAELANPDGYTARFRALADGWCDTLGLSDAEVAERMRADGIDILICLAGHFDRNRPLVCAHRPAPVQVSFHDPLTSGLDAMDYLIADPVLVPRGGSEPFVERVVRLPSFYLAEPLHGAPALTPPPALAAGGVTFGSFNVPSKLSAPVQDLWARVLHAVPGSRLMLKYRNLYGVPGLRARMETAFRERGIPSERLVFRSSVDDAGDHLSLYGGVDIALDPFPFCGSTTSYEALWMGVPVVTLPGDGMVGRWTAAMLRPLRLEALIAGSAEEYVAICQRLAADLPALARLRAELRGRIAASPLCDGRRRTRQIERLYRAMWRRWCAGTR